MYISFLSQVGGTHSWWVTPDVRGEKHTPVKRVYFLLIVTFLSHKKLGIVLELQIITRFFCYNFDMVNYEWFNHNFHMNHSFILYQSHFTTSQLLQKFVILYFFQKIK